ncbi:MAG: putative periplasmic solute-binding protein [Clostridiaceae bacterium]|nr:putative periplasmic solute-binding protein [Clostridiaceae bacterium]
MRKVHEKSIILGIGIGMIITSIAGMIYSGGVNKEIKAEDLSKDEIIRLAKNYGMIEKVEFLNGDAAQNTQTGNTADSEAKDTKDANKTDQKTVTENSEESKSTPSQNTTQNTTQNDDRNIVIEIKKGYKSQDVIDMLLEKGVISDEKKFKSVMYAYNVTKKVNFGTFRFKKDEDYDYILRTICDIK